MRILILHNYYQHLGGEDIVVHQEVDALKKHGHEVLVMTDKNKKGLKGLLQYGLYPFNKLASIKLMKEINCFAPDVIHLHNIHYALGPLIVRSIRKKNYPLVMTLHNFRLICPSATLFYNNNIHRESIFEKFPWQAVKSKALDNSFLKSLITAFTYWLHNKIGTWNMISYYFTLSAFAKNILIESQIDISNNKFIVKPNFCNVATESINKKVFEDYFIYVGRLSAEKGVIPLIKAFSKMNHRIKIYGDGPLRKEVEAYANLYRNIEYMGFKDKDFLNEEVKKANALIVPSICYEGMPMGILEAFSLGTPVLCSNIGVMSQMITPMKTGLHFEANSPLSIADCVNQWSRLNIEEKMIMSINCINDSKKLYSLNKSIDILEITYKKAIEENE